MVAIRISPQDQNGFLTISNLGLYLDSFEDEDLAKLTDKVTHEEFWFCLSHFLDTTNSRIAKKRK